MAKSTSTRTHSRRGVLKAAAAGGAALGLIAAGAGAGKGNAAIDSSDAAPIVAYISDARAGEIVVMVGTTEIVRRDAGLVARLVAIAREARDVIAS